MTECCDRPESWRPVPFEPFNLRYSVSDHGRIRNDDADREMKRSRGIDINYYWHVRLSYHGEYMSFRVANLVANAFLGPRPDGHQINHIDCDSGNDHASNLEYVTPQEHERHTVANKLHVHAPHRLTPEAVREIRSYPRGARVMRQLAEKYGVTRGAIRQVRTGRAWRSDRGSPYPSSEEPEKE